MLHEKPVRYDPPGGDEDDMNMAWKSEKRRRMHLTQTSSSDAPTATAQGHEAPISYALCLFEPGEAAKDHQGQISDMAIVQAQDHALLPRMDSGEEEETQELLGPHAMNLESGRKFKEPKAYSEDEIGGHGYFKHLEEDESFEWFFHTADSWIPDLEDYQRIVLRNFMPGRMEAEYLDVDGYRELYHTYEMDAVYVKYYGEISKKIKVFVTGVAKLVHFHSGVHILELREDASLKDLDLVYFEIWRLVIKDKRNYMDAVKELYGMDKFHIHKRIYWITQERGIDFNTEDNKARDLFRKGVARLKIKNMANYAKKKMEIGEWLNLQVVFVTGVAKLVHFHSGVHILELREDASLKDLDLVYFEIWRLVIKDKRNYMDAVKELYGMDKFHIHKRIYWITQERGIDFNTEDNKARDLFRKGVARLKIKNMANYAKKKMEIGEWLNLQVVNLQIEVPGPGRKH
ncbi:hypothetical protein ACQ4PT_013063 [Festuca glaucescens]